VTFAYATHHAGAKVAGLRALQWTDSAPGLPLIGSMALTAFQVADLREVLDGVGNTRPDLMAELALTGFSQVPQTDYQIIAEQEAAAKRLGYLEIA
jgi:ABC-type phosphate/phosphonate transport system substrate-binding protein